MVTSGIRPNRGFFSQSKSFLYEGPYGINGISLPKSGPKSFRSFVDRRVITENPLYTFAVRGNQSWHFEKKNRSKQNVHMNICEIANYNFNQHNKNPWSLNTFLRLRHWFYFLFNLLKLIFPIRLCSKIESQKRYVYWQLA